MLNKNFLLILLTNVLLGAPMPMLIILGGLAGAAIAPVDQLITVPISAQLLAGILVASPLSVLMGRIGRRSGFILVAAATTLGALLAAASVYWASFPGLCLAHFLMGAALTGVNFLRFVATEVVPEAYRASAISYTLASGIVAALLGPSLFDMTNDALAQAPFVGAYAAIAVMGVLGAIPIVLMSLPDFKGEKNHSQKSVTTALHLLADRPSLRVAIGVAAAAQAVMVLLMVPTPHAMMDHGFNQNVASDVIRWHVVAMFAPGLFTGALIRWVGVNRVMVCGLVMLLVAALIAIAGTGTQHFYLSLILMGVGWNFGFVGGTHLLQASTNADEKPAMQGLNDTLVAISSVSASVLSGMFYVGLGWAMTSMLVVPLLFLMLVWLAIEISRDGSPSTI